MSLDDRVTREIRRQAGSVDGSGLPSASTIAAKARRRVRRRQIGGGVALILLLVVGASVVVAAASDDDDSTDIRTEVPTTIATETTLDVPTTVGPTTVHTVPSFGTTTTLPPQPTTRAAGTCSPRVLFTDMPDGWERVVRDGAGGGTGAPGAHIEGGAGRYIDVLGPDATFTTTGTSTLALPTMGVSATLAEIHEGIAATIPSATPCGDSFTLAGYGISAEDFERVLLGMRPEFQCSASGLDDTTPASLSEASGLPTAVLASANAVRQATIACDFARLGQLAVTGTMPELGFHLTEGAEDVSMSIAVADWLRWQEASGVPVMRQLAGILTLEPYRFDYENEPGAYYFPRFCQQPLTDDDWNALVPIYGAEEVAAWRAMNADSSDFRDSYVGGRCAGFNISDGRWSSLFVLIA